MRTHWQYTRLYSFDIVPCVPNGNIDKFAVPPQIFALDLLEIYVYFFLYNPYTITSLYTQTFGFTDYKKNELGDFKCLWIVLNNFQPLDSAYVNIFFEFQVTAIIFNRITAIINQIDYWMILIVYLNVPTKRRFE